MFSWSMDGQLRRETTCVDVGEKLTNGRRKTLLRDCQRTRIAAFQHKKVDLFFKFVLVFSRMALYII